MKSKSREGSVRFVLSRTRLVSLFIVVTVLVAILPGLTPARWRWAWAASTAAPSVWSAGDNEAWELGRTDSTEGVAFIKQSPCREGCTGSSTPEAISGLPGVTALAAGDLFGLALEWDGTVWSWGYNADGELGNNSTIDSATPVQVSGLSGVVSIAAGAWAGYAIESDGSLWAWGRNDTGQLGIGSTTNALTPHRVGSLTGVVGVAGTVDSAVAVTSSGTAWTWGNNVLGELCADRKKVSQRATPAQVSGISSVKLVAGSVDDFETYFVRTDGSVWGCGSNEYGNLAGTAKVVTSPTQVPGLPPITQVAATGTEAWALTAQGALWTWGHYDCAPSLPCSNPRLDGLSNVTAITAGYDNLYAIRGSTLWGTGGNPDGQLGATLSNGEFQLIANVSNPTAIASGFEDFYAAADAPPPQYIPPAPPPTAQTFGDISQPSEFAPRDVSTQADPVDSATGAFSTSATDISLPGIGLGIDWTRTYTSSDPAGSGELGPGWSNSYSDRLEQTQTGVTLHSHDGQQVTFTANADGTFSGTYGATATLVKNADGTYTLTTRTQLHYIFDTTGLLAAVQDRNGQGPTISRDTAGKISSITAAGRTITVAHDPTTGLLSSLTLSDGRYVGFTFTNGLLTDIHNLDGSHTTYGYDAGNRLTSITDANGHQVVRLVYDSNTGRVTDQYDANNNHTTFTWDSTTQTSSMTDPRGHVWKDAYSGTVLLSQTNPLGQTTKFQYDNQYRLVATTDPAGYTTRETYDSSGNLIGESTPDGATYAYTYDSLNDQTSSTSPNGLTATLTYDNRGNLIATSRPNPSGGAPITTSFTRDPNTGLITDSYDALGKKTHYDYDTAGNRIDVITPLGNKTSWTYDAFGRMTSIVAARGNVTGANPDDYRTSYTYDDGNRLLTTVDALNHVAVETNTYDPVGNLLTRTDAKQRTTTWSYYPDNQVQTVQPPSPISATSYSYDANDNLAQLTQPGNHITTYGYDDANRLTSTTTGMGTWTFGYDASGNRTKITDPAGNNVRFSYDPLHRLTQIVYSDQTPTTTYAYDLDGNRTTMSDGSGVTTYAYDTLDRLTSVTHAGHTFSYTYDNANQLTSSTFPGQATDIYTYDNDGQLSTVATGATTDVSYSYDPDGHVISALLGDGYTESRTWDRDGRLTDINDTKNGTVLTRATYTYDLTNNPVSVVNQTGSTTTYTYDVLDRLTAACFATTSCTTATDYVKYTYDDMGNRLTETRPAGTTTYTYNAANELTQTSGPAGATSYGYDVDGNQTSAGSNTYTYNQAGRITSQTVGGTTTSFTYDGDARRLSASAGNTTTDYLWDPRTYQLAVETDGAGNTLRRYTYGSGLVSMVVPGSRGTTTAYYYHVDGQGSPLAVTDATGATQWQYTWEPYGLAKTATKVSNSAPANPRQWLGEYLNNDSTYNLRARQYDPSIGRFTSIDPAGSGDAYGYAADNPLVNTDPFGQSWWHSALKALHNAAEVVSTVAAVAAVVTAPIAPVAAVFGAVALGAGVVAAGTGIAEAVDTCNSGKGSCAGSIVDAAFDTASIVPLFGIARKVATGAKVADVARGLGDEAVVVRGGTSAVPPPGEVFSGAYGSNLEDAAAYVPHGQIRATTVGEIRAGGGSVDVAPELTRSGVLNERHVNICLGSDECPFGDLQPNPVPKIGRIQ